MRTLKKKEKGGGILQKIGNLFSGKKTIKKKYLEHRKLSNENEKRKKSLQKKWSKTQQEKEELALLAAKLEPVEENKKEAYEKALQNRPKIKKFFNRPFVPSKLNKPASITEIEGVMTIVKNPQDQYSVANKRNPLSKEGLRIPNNQIPTPPMLSPSASRNINGEEVEVAGQATMTYYNAPLYYAQWKQEPPKEKLEDIPDEDFQDFLNELKDFNDARDIFHIDPAISVDAWFLEMEEGAGFAQGIYNTINFQYTFEDGFTIKKKLIKASSSVSVERLFNDLKKGKIKILKAVEADLATCRSPYDVNDAPDHFTPLTTLKSNGCIQFFRDLHDFEGFIALGQVAKSWIMIPRPYNLQDIPIHAKFIRSMRVFREALDDWAIQGIDSALLELFLAKYPELSIRMSSYILNTYDFPYQMNKFKFTDNYIILDKVVFQKTISFTALCPFTEDSQYYSILRKASFQRRLYGMSPYIAYMMKKLNRILFKRCFKSEGNDKNLGIYDTLNPYEKITMDFLQNLRFMETLKDSDYNFQQARNTYMDFLGDQQDLIELFEENLVENTKQLQFYQSLVTRQVPEYLRDTFLESIEDIQNLLRKFLPIQSILPPSQMLTRRQPPLQRTMSAFNRVVTIPKEVRQNENRREAERRVKELEAWLSENKETYNSIVKQRGEESNLKRQLNYFTKLKKFEKNTRRLGNIIRKEQQTRKNYEFVRNYPMKEQKAKQELVRRRNTLQQLGYYPLPSGNTMA